MSFFPGTLKLKLMRSLVTKTSPLYVQYYVTARCNMHCEQCNIIYAQADCPEMNIQQIRKMAENLAEIGVCIVLLIGGEPFVRKDLPEIVKAFVDNHIHVRMQTNGLATKKMLADCIKAGGHDISVSLDTLDKNIQDSINGIPNTWERAIQTVAHVNEMFPDYGKAFFGTVIMPRNIHFIKDVIEFATAVGWGVSLVPCHSTTPERPLGFRIFSDYGECSFPTTIHDQLKVLIEDLKECRNEGLNLYDCDEYLDDTYRFITGKPVKWRRRNNNICDSPNLYFAIEPNGNIQPCCDYKLEKAFSVFEKDFPRKFRSGEIHEKIYFYTATCDGCMYGSFPEITLTARFLKPLIHRFLLFNTSRENSRLKRYTKAELLELSTYIYKKNNEKREAQATNVVL